MWCARCHYGSECCSMSRCPKCNSYRFEFEKPFPDKPTRMGSGYRKAKKNLTIRLREDATAGQADNTDGHG